MRYTLLFQLVFLSYFSSIAQEQFFWTDPIEVASSSFGRSYPRIELNGNNQPLITWGHQGNIYFSKMESGIFTNPIQLNNDTTIAYTANWTGADIAARNDSIYVGFMHQSWGGKTYLVRSFDNGNSFSTPTRLESYSNYSSRFPSLTIDQTGQPVAAIMKMESNGHNPQYVIRRSTDYGATFSLENDASGWSGGASEACDCCPAALFSQEENIALLYRDNLNNIRDIWAGISNDNGNSIDSGFAVDNNGWQITSCPASGPDGAIVGDFIYAVFLSGNQVYLSKTNIYTGEIEYVNNLSEGSPTTSKNFPRISAYENEVAICWRENYLGSKLQVAYTSDITNNEPFQVDTVLTEVFHAADIKLGPTGIHLAIESSSTNTVKYMFGNLSPVSFESIKNQKILVYPNPAEHFLFVSNSQQIRYLEIYDLSGKYISKKKASSQIDISNLGSGFYILKCILKDGNTYSFRFNKLQD